MIFIFVVRSIFPVTEVEVEDVEVVVCPELDDEGLDCTDCDPEEDRSDEVILEDDRLVGVVVVTTDDVDIEKKSGLGSLLSAILKQLPALNCCFKISKYGFLNLNLSPLNC